MKDFVLNIRGSYIKKVSSIFLCLLVVLGTLNAQFILPTMQAKVDASITAKLTDSNITLQRTTGITSNIVVGHVPSGVSILESTSITVPVSAKFSFTSDDGAEKDYKFRDVFVNRGVSGIIPVITDYISQTASAGQVTIGHLLELQNTYGYEIGSHTYSHPRLTNLSLNDVIFQLTESKRLMIDMGLRIDNFYVPFGAYTEEILDEAAKIYRSSRISQSGSNTLLVTRKLRAYWLDAGGITLEEAKQVVRTASTNNYFIIFGFHAGVASRTFMDNTVGALIDYIHTFNNTQVLTVNKSLDRIQNVINKDIDYRVVNGEIVLDKFFVRSLPLGDNTVNFNFSDGTSESLVISIVKDIVVDPDPEPTPRAATSIAITTKPTKLTYTEGESLNLAGMVVKANFNDGTSDTITGYTVSGYSSTQGTKTITVSYSGFTATFTVEVTGAASGLGTPTDILAESKTYNSIKLSWSSVIGAGGYTVYQSNSIDGPYTFLSNRTPNNITVTGLAKGMTYYYTISAYKVVGGNKVYGSESAPVSIMPVPAAPANFNVSLSGSTSAQVSWYAAPGATDYELFRSTVSGGEFTLLKATHSASFKDTTLGGGTTYYYKVRGYCLVNGIKIYGNFSAVKSVTTSGSPTPTVSPVEDPGQILGIDIITPPAKLVYNIGENLDITGMIVKCRFSDNSTVTVTDFTVSGYTSTAGTKTVTVSYLGFSDTFTVEVTSSSVTVGIPGSPYAQSRTYNSIVLTWDAVSGADGYSIYRALSYDGTYSLVGSRVVTSLINSGLTSGQVYYYKVSAYKTVAGVKVYGGLSDSTSVIPMPAEPMNFGVIVLSANSIKSTWKTVAGSTGYELYMSNTPDGTNSMQITTVNPSYVNTKLASNTTYYFRVRAFRTVEGTKVFGSFTEILAGTTH